MCKVVAKKAISRCSITAQLRHHLRQDGHSRVPVAFRFESRRGDHSKPTKNWKFKKVCSSLQTWSRTPIVEYSNLQYTKWCQKQYLLCTLSSVMQFIVLTSSMSDLKKNHECFATKNEFATDKIDPPFFAAVMALHWEYTLNVNAFYQNDWWKSIRREENYIWYAVKGGSCLWKYSTSRLHTW